LAQTLAYQASGEYLTIRIGAVSRVALRGPAKRGARRDKELQKQRIQNYHP
jgi:hypothetical protein